MAELNFEIVRPLFGKMNQSQVDGVNAIVTEWNKRGFTDLRWLAYILATVFHETGKKMQPVKEFGGERYLKLKAYYPYYGRDLVQTTWRFNYERVKKFTGLDVVTNPDLIQTVAVPVAVEFMVKGYYTGKKLGDYFNLLSEDWHNARRIINGVDKAGLIAGYGKKFYRGLIQGIQL